jgi:hypothetical protein
MDKFMDYVHLLNALLLAGYFVAYFRLRIKHNNLTAFTMRLSDDAIRIKNENDKLKGNLYG